MRLVRNNVRKNTENPRRDEEEWRELKNTFSGELDFSAKIKANKPGVGTRRECLIAEEGLNI